MGDPTAYPVHIGGSQRGMLEGDTRTHVRVRELLDRPHLYAVGPGEGIRGEVTVIDSVVSVTRVDEAGRWVVTQEPDAGACFLVWSYVPLWREYSCPVAGLDDLERALEELANEAGMPATGPMPFLVEAASADVTLHALNKPDEDGHSLKQHHAAKVHATFADRPVLLVGFYAHKGHGAFTPPDSVVHCHVCTTDDGAPMCGHVDGVRFGDGPVRVFLPDVSAADGYATDND